MRPFPSLMMLSGGRPVVPQTINITTTGAGSWQVLPYNTLVLKLWGGGGSGAKNVNGNGGGTTSFTDGSTNPTAFGGQGGKTAGTDAPGGTASGGDVNTSGAVGQASATLSGGSSPNGGARSSGVGNAPGGGGAREAPAGSDPSGGGGGAFCQKTYTTGELTLDDFISYNVGVGATAISTMGFEGADGKIQIIIS